MSNDGKNQYISRADVLRIVDETAEYKPARLARNDDYKQGWIDACEWTKQELNCQIYHSEVAPIVHAEWEIKLVSGKAKAVCSRCGMPNKKYTPPYCPHCGAKMERCELGDDESELQCAIEVISGVCAQSKNRCAKCLLGEVREIGTYCKIKDSEDFPSDWIPKGMIRKNQEAKNHDTN